MTSDLGLIKSRCLYDIRSHHRVIRYVTAEMKNKRGIVLCGIPQNLLWGASPDESKMQTVNKMSLRESAFRGLINESGSRTEG